MLYSWTDTIPGIILDTNLSCHHLQFRCIHTHYSSYYSECYRTEEAFKYLYSFLHIWSAQDDIVLHWHNDPVWLSMDICSFHIHLWASSVLHCTICLLFSYHFPRILYLHFLYSTEQWVQKAMGGFFLSRVKEQKYLFLKSTQVRDH